MAQYYTILTTIGLAKIANAVATNTPVALSAMALGDGNGNPTTPSASQTALVREVYRGALNQLNVDPDVPNRILAELAVPSNVGGWTVREVGLFDEDGNLFAVANFPDAVKPQIAEGAGRDMVVRIYMDVVNSDAVQLKVDPTIVIASRQWCYDNFTLGVMAPGGLTNQILRKKSNADGDVEWANASGFNFVVTAVVEMQTLAENQVIVDLAQVGTAGMALHIEGAREFEGTGYTINSDSRFTLSRSYAPGTRIWVSQNEPLDEVDDVSVRRTGGTTVKAAIDAIETKLSSMTKTADRYVFAIGGEFKGSTSIPCVREVIAATSSSDSRSASRLVYKKSNVVPTTGMGTFEQYVLEDLSNGGFGYLEFARSGFQYKKFTDAAGTRQHGAEYLIEVFDVDDSDGINGYDPALVAYVFGPRFATFKNIMLDTIGTKHIKRTKADTDATPQYFGMPTYPASNFIEVEFSGTGSIYILGALPTPPKGSDGLMCTVFGSHNTGLGFVLGCAVGTSSVPAGTTKILMASHKAMVGTFKLTASSTTIGGGVTSCKLAKMEFRYSASDSAWLLISAKIDTVATNG